MQVAKWGNSLAVRIPKDVVETLGIREGDNIDLCAIGGEQVAVITERQRREEALAAIRKLRGWMPADYKFNREEANAR